MTDTTGDRTPTEVPELIPARMLNEYAYCPRLAYLEWVQGEWEENRETAEGDYAHRRVHEEKGQRAVVHDRSVQLSSERLGLTAKLDLLVADGNRARPVDYKRGKKPPVREGAWEPERVQVCAQGLLLREHGYECNEGLLYFVGSKEKVRVRFTDALVARTLELASAMRAMMASGRIPPPLEDSPKCPRCSLVRVCLPEEIRYLKSGGEMRPLVVSDARTHPLVVQDPSAGVRLSGEELIVESDDPPARVRMGELSQVVLVGGARVTTPAVTELCRRGIPIVYMSGSGWLTGITNGFTHKNIGLRIEQFAAARDSERSIAVARNLVAAAIRNGRVLLRRNGNPSRRALLLLEAFARRAETVVDADRLLGTEGSAARIYYREFSSMLKGQAAAMDFNFRRRTRRPPLDPINAMLSFTYGLLTKEWVTTLTAVGFDPLLGLYHRPRFGRPALALDMMEPFRRLVADSTVVGAVNNGELRADDFYSHLGGVFMRPAARRRLIAAYERRLAQEIRHPIFGYSVSYRRLFELEARLLARHLLGETPSYQPFQTR